MSKVKIILLSILGVVVLTTATLFFGVFRLRTQTVTARGDISALNISNEDIIKTGGLKKGKSIFLLNKDKAKEKIEKTYPYLKVIGIKTQSVTKVKYLVRERKETFFTMSDNKYYIMDEDLKVLRIVETAPNLTEIEAGILKITNKTVVSDFVGDKYYQDTIYDFYVAMITNAKLGEKYFEREDFTKILTISFEDGFTKASSYKRLVMEMDDGTIFDFAIPSKDLKRKVNLCFGAYNELTLEEKQDLTIKFYLDENGKEKIGCFYN